MNRALDQGKGDGGERVYGICLMYDKKQAHHTQYYRLIKVDFIS